MIAGDEIHDTKKVLIVDNQPLARRGAAEVIAAEGGLVVCAEAADLKGALAAIDSNEPDLALVDIALGADGGLGLIRNLISHRPDLRVLVLSMHDEGLYAERAVQAGARGYVGKTEPAEKLVQAVRAVLRGEVYLSERMTGRLLAAIAEGRRDAGKLTIDGLTAREFEVFELIGELLEPRQIARRLQVSIKTVESHREHIKGKLHIRSAGELRSYAVKWARLDGRV